MTQRRSLKFPLVADGEGGLLISEDSDVIRDRIFSVLLTRQYERVLRPRYGSRDYTFESRPSVRPVVEAIRTSLEANIPEVDSFEVYAGVDLDAVAPTTLYIRIDWVLNGSPQVAVEFDITR